MDYVSQFVATSLCKSFAFFAYISSGVSMLSLVVITVYRFSAVMFPTKARIPNKRKRKLVLLLTWAVPIAVNIPELVYESFDEHKRCYFTITLKQWSIWWSVGSSLFFLLPLLSMLVMYPVILVKLRQHKVPGNANRSHAVIRRKQNFRLTIMFIVISTAFVLTRGPFTVLGAIHLYFPTCWSQLKKTCSFTYLRFARFGIPVVFHAINPMIYFIFCSSYRKGLRQAFSCSCRGARDHRANAVGDNVELNVFPSYQ